MMSTLLLLAATVRAGAAGKGILVGLIVVGLLLLRAWFIDMMSRG